MSAKKYIAMQAVQLVDADGVRRSVEPKSEKHSGLFEHAFDAKTEKRLIAVGAIREPEGTEQHEDPTEVAAMDDTRDDADAKATKPKASKPAAAKGDDDLLKG